MTDTLEIFKALADEIRLRILRAVFAAELFSRLIGRALPRAQGGHERLPNLQALPILSSDALSSVAYATEASLGVLILAGSSALKQSLPITLAIIALIAIVVLSYRKAISAYPNGGGSYVVARENLGRNVSLVAAAALLIDYVLTAAVSLMAGTQALSSLVPSLLPHELALSMLLLAAVVIALVYYARSAKKRAYNEGT